MADFELPELFKPSKTELSPTNQDLIKGIHPELHDVVGKKLERLDHNLETYTREINSRKQEIHQKMHEKFTLLMGQLKDAFKTTKQLQIELPTEAPYGYEIPSVHLWYNCNPLLGEVINIFINMLRRKGYTPIVKISPFKDLGADSWGDHSYDGGTNLIMTCDLENNQ